MGDDGEIIPLAPPEPVVPATDPPDPFHSASTPGSKWSRYNADGTPRRGNNLAKGQKASKESQAKRDAFLGFIQQGMTVEKACKQAGVVLQTYYYWKKADKDFKARVDLARHQNQVNNGMEYRGNFATFRDTFLPLEFSTPSFHMQIIDRLEQAPPMSVTMVLVPPNFGKTTLLEDWTNYKLATDPNHRITIASKSQGQARKFLARVQRRMTDIHQFGKYIGRFGPFYVEGQERQGKPWTRDYFSVNKFTADERDYSLQCIGWSGQIYGSRVDTLVLDDIQTRDNLSSVDSMLEKLTLEFFTRQRDGRIFIIGTRIEVGDIYERIIDLDIIPSERLVIMPAVNGEGESLWPERWPEADLATMHKMVGEKTWWCGYMQQPSLGGQATFDEEMLDASLSRIDRTGVKPDDMADCPVVLGLDPALGGGNALMAAVYNSDRIHTLDCIRETGLARTEDILARVEEFAVRYHPQDVIIETVAFQRGLARDDRMEALARKYGFRIHEHQTHRNKLDPIMGVGSMATSFLRREITIPWGAPYDEVRFGELIGELRAWRPNVPTRLIQQDLVMSLWFCWLWIMQARRGMQMDPSMWKRRGMPFKPSEYTPTLAGVR